MLEFGDAFRGSINLAVSPANPLEPKGDDQIRPLKLLAAPAVLSD